MKLLITGSEGFIGKHVVRIAEERGHRVTGVDRKNGKTLGTYRLEHFDAIIHLAADIDITESFKDPWKYVDNNIATLKMLKQANRVVFASSAAVYGEHSPYGLTKALGEFLLPENSVSLRLFNPFGPGEDHEPETHIIPLLAKQHVTLHHFGEQIRDFIYVEDAAEAFVLAAESDITGHYDLCDTPLRIWEVAELMGASYDKVAGGRDSGDTLQLKGDKFKLQMKLGWHPKHDVREELKNYAK